MTDNSAASVPGPGNAASDSNNSAAADADDQPHLSIRMVIQRYRRASILLDESRVVTVGESMEESQLSRDMESLLLNPGATDDSSQTTTTSLGSHGEPPRHQAVIAVNQIKRERVTHDMPTVATDSGHRQQLQPHVAGYHGFNRTLSLDHTPTCAAVRMLCTRWPACCARRSRGASQ